jgi:hypothetical protein
MVTVLWWLVLARALIGTLFLIIGIQMILHARDEIVLRAAKGQNGMEAEILKGQVRFGWLRAGALAILASSAWLSLPFVGRTPLYRWPQIVASALVLLLTCMEAVGVFLKWRERGRLLWMARDYRKKTTAEGGRGEPGAA